VTVRPFAPAAQPSGVVSEKIQQGDQESPTQRRHWTGGVTLEVLVE
jgi:hypothetical protein